MIDFERFFCIFDKMWTTNHRMELSTSKNKILIYFFVIVRVVKDFSFFSIDAVTHLCLGLEFTFLSLISR